MILLTECIKVDNAKIGASVDSTKTIDNNGLGEGKKQDKYYSK